MGYRCHFTRNGRIVAGDDLASETLGDAIQCGLGMLADRSIVDDLDGIEIWEGDRFLYPSEPNICSAIQGFPITITISTIGWQR
jgi:hypothetical protein